MNGSADLSPDMVLLDVEATSMKQLLKQIASHASSLVDVQERAIFDALIERERLGTTAVGDGVAIPHARLKGLKEMVALFFRVQDPVDAHAADNRPVDLLFVLLAPEDGDADHLKALARIARILRDKENCAMLRKGQDPEAIRTLLVEAA